MRHMTLTLPRPAVPRLNDDARLATDLGRVLEDILEHTSRGVCHVFARHDLDPLAGRIMREVQESLGPDTPLELARRTGIEPHAVAATLAQLEQRGLIADPGAGFGLTPAGRRIVAELDRTRREDLLAFVRGLDEGRRRRFDAALHLLSPELDAA